MKIIEQRQFYSPREGCVVRLALVEHPLGMSIVDEHLHPTTFVPCRHAMDTHREYLDDRMARGLTTTSPLPRTMDQEQALHSIVRDFPLENLAWHCSENSRD